MKENFFLITSGIYFTVLIYLLDFWNSNPEAGSSESETHARTRYAVADQIQKELQGR